MSPILVRPVREQLEHDRLIRFLLLNKYKKRFEAAGNPGDERSISVKVGPMTLFPDIVLVDGKKVAGLVEVETGESVNNLEALAEWVHFGKARAPFYLYVPMTSVDAARRLCDLHLVQPTEIWTYRGTMDGFDLVRVHHNPAASGPARGEAVTLVKVATKVPASPATAVSEAASNGQPTPAKASAEGPARKATKKPEKPEKVEKPEQVEKPVKAVAKRAPKAKAPKPVKRSIKDRKSAKAKPKSKKKR